MPNEVVPLELGFVQGAQDVESVYLQYWVEASLNSEIQELSESEPGIWHTDIPKGFAISEDLYYLFEIRLKNGKIEHLPRQRGKEPFFVLKPKIRVGVFCDAFVRLNEEERISQHDDYLLVVSFMEIEEELDKGCIKVFVDDQDVTKKLVISGSTFVYRQSKPKPGLKKAIVRARLKGREVYSETWITEVVGNDSKMQIPFEYHGSVNMAANSYSSQTKARVFGNSKNDFATWADLYGSYGIMQLSSQLYLSSLEDSNKQPINRYSFGVKIPYLEVNAGDYSPDFSSFSLSGKNIRGIHSRIDTPYLKLDLVHGQALRKSIYSATQSQPASGSFRQEAIGGKITVGDEEGFSLSLIGSRHRDLISSLKPEYYSYYEAAKGDSILHYSSFAQDNLVFAADMRVNVPEQNVILGVEAAASLLNKNTLPGAFSAQDWDDYGVEMPEIIEEFGDLFVINSNVEPLELGRSNLAWKIYLKALILNNLINVDYQETGASFTALGTSHQPRDTRQISVSDQFTYGQYLYLNALYNRVEDNLMKRSAESTLQELIFAQVMLRYPHLPYLKAGLNVNKLKNEENKELENDYFSNYLQDSNTLNFALGYDFYQIPHVPTQLEISYRTGDAKREREISNLMQPTMERELSYTGFSMVNRFQIVPLKLQMNYLGGSETESSLKLKNSRFYLRAEYALFANILKPFISYSISSFSGDQDEQKLSLMALGLNAYPLKNLSVSTEFALKDHRNKSTADQDYKLNTWRFLIIQRF